MAERAVTKLDQSPAAIKKAVEAALIDALVIAGYHRNPWHSDPKRIRWGLQGATLFMSVLSAWSFSHNGYQRYTFAIFAAILGTLAWLWHRIVEFGGGNFIFSPDWRDTFVKIRVTPTNVVLSARVGYEVDLLASLPLSLVAEHITEDGLDEEWLADEVHQQFNYP